MSFERWGWPASRCGMALEAAVRGRGRSRSAGESVERRLEQAVPALAEWVGLKATHVAVDAGDLRAALSESSPMLIEVAGTDLLLAVAHGGSRRVRLETPGGPVRVSTRELAADLSAAAERGRGEAVASLDRAMGSPSPRRRSVLRRLLSGEAERVRLWVIEPGPYETLATVARWRGLVRRALTPVLAHLAEYGLYVVGWWLIGRMALGGLLEAGWMLAWALLFIAWAPLRALVARADNRFAIDVGLLLRQRLLAGSLRMPAGEASRLGVGGIMGRVLEADAIENVAVVGGLMAVTSVLDLVVVTVLLGLGAGGLPHAGLLVAFAVCTAGVFTAFHRDRRRWTESRNAMTGDLVEQMVGHRTRIAQDVTGSQEELEDTRLAGYHPLGAGMDRWHVVLTAIPRVWFIASVLLLAAPFVGGAVAVTPLAIAVAATVLGGRAFYRIASAAEPISRAIIALDEVAPLLRRPADGDLPGDPAADPAPQAVVRAHDLAYRYPSTERAVIRNQSLEVPPASRILIEGPSGAGKSTLAALISAGREPDVGVVLLGGYDRATLGHRTWRRRIALVPQFHDNHLLLGSLAFNLLLGRRWPATHEDLADAEATCTQLGLGPLLERMPSGLFQVVGETGWQLSHGERSRVFLARALLQRPDLLVLDESLGSLDPETLLLAGGVVLDAPSAVIAIAHP